MKSFKKILFTFLFFRLVFGQEISSSLEKNLKYSQKYNDYQGNALFGSLLCHSDMLSKGNRKEIYEYGLKTIKKLQEIIEKGNELQSNIIKSIIFSEYSKNNQSLGDRVLRIGQLAMPLEIPPYNEYLVLVDNGVPDKDLSDKCISETLSSKTCVISSQCLEVLTGPMKSYGYHKTHQILLALFLLRQNCTASIPFNLSLRTLLWRQCSQVLKESVLLYSKINPSGVQDLFLEQLLFCGMSGFSEFLSEIFVVKALSFQRSDGCFALSTEKNSQCSSHMTGLGLALLCRLIKIVQQFDIDDL